MFLFQIEAVLHNILQELKILYANHAPQLKPRSSQATGVATSASLSSASSSSEQLTCDSPEGYSGNMETIESIDPVTDMYNILEGSSLIPFAEVGIRMRKLVSEGITQAL